MSNVNISQRVKDTDYFLRTLMHAKSGKQRRLLLKYASREELMSLAEVVTNFLLGNLVIDNKENFPLYVKNKRLFRVLGFSGRKSWKKRQQAALDLGRVLVVFLKDVLPVVFYQ